jgi:NAD(P)H dehydrogenase (quinone)
MIIITQGNTSFGRLVVRALLRRVPASDVAVTSPRPSDVADLVALGVEVRSEDFTDPAAATGIFRDAHRVLSNPPPGWHRNDATEASATVAREALEAAIAARVPHLVHVGIANVERTNLLWHDALEGLVRGGGVPYSILRLNLHTEALLPAVELARHTHELVCSFGDRTVAPASRLDYAEAVARVLTEGGPADDARTLTGFGLTALGVASVFSEVVGHDIALREVDGAQVAAELTSRGATPEDAALLADLDAAAADGEFSPQTETLDSLLGHAHQLNVPALLTAIGASR